SDNRNGTSSACGGDSEYGRLRRCGANYWVMSAVEYGRFIAGLSHGKIVSPAGFKAMRDGQLGMYIGVTPPFTATTGGDNWNHNGGLTFGNGAGMQGDWMMLPKDVT